MPRIAVAIAVFLAATSIAPRSDAVPTEQVHNLNWFVHQCLIDAESLVFYQNLIDDRLAEATDLLQGLQGPADLACCSELARASVSAFGTCGDGLDIITTELELDAVEALGSGSYIVESVHYCTSFSTSIRGCASTPGDFLVVGREADDNFFLSTVIAHERGHNSNLNHVTNNPCELMAASSAGGCVSSSECSAFISKADGTGGLCDCLGDNVGDPTLPDGAACSDVGGCEVCSGGLCGGCTSGALSRVLVAGGIGTSSSSAADDALEQSVTAGDWTDLGNISGSAEYAGLAYDAPGNVIFGIETQVGNESLVTIDPETGAKTGTVGSVTGDNVIALAYDEDNDVLYGIQLDATLGGTPFDCVTNFGFTPCISNLIEIDPDDATTTLLGSLNAFIVQFGFQGLAYDDGRDELYGSTAAGMIEIDLSTCNGFTCVGTTQLDNRFLLPSSLSYDDASDRLIRQGSTGGPQTRIDYFDPVTGATQVVRGIDVFTAGGAAAIPVPEPAVDLGLLFGAVGLLGLGRLSGRRSDA